MQSHLGLPPRVAQSSRWRTMAAIQVESSEQVRALHQQLLAQRCAVRHCAAGLPLERLCLLLYRSGRQSLGDLYTWQEGGHANLIFSGEADLA